MVKLLLLAGTERNTDVISIRTLSIRATQNG